MAVSQVIWKPSSAIGSAVSSFMRFRLRNIKLGDEIYPHYKDRAKLIAANKAGRQQFEEQMAREREERQRRSGRGWDALGDEEERAAKEEADA